MFQTTKQLGTILWGSQSSPSFGDAPTQEVGRSTSSADSQQHQYLIQQLFLESPDNDHPAALKASTVEETVNLKGTFQ